jgi:hypothetical protein
VVILYVTLDATYQLIVHRGVYLGELMIVAIVLAIVPYFLVRGPLNRVSWNGNTNAVINVAGSESPNEQPAKR